MGVAECAGEVRTDTVGRELGSGRKGGGDEADGRVGEVVGVHDEQAVAEERGLVGVVDHETAREAADRPPGGGPIRRQGEGPQGRLGLLTPRRTRRSSGPAGDHSLRPCSFTLHRPPTHIRL